MTWLLIDAVCAYAGGVPRKTIYGWVRKGMKVARTGDSGRRMIFADLWVDEFLQRSAAEPHVVKPHVVKPKATPAGEPAAAESVATEAVPQPLRRRA